MNGDMSGFNSIPGSPCKQPGIPGMPGGNPGIPPPSPDIAMKGIPGIALLGLVLAVAELAVADAAAGFIAMDAMNGLYNDALNIAAE